MKRRGRKKKSTNKQITIVQKKKSYTRSLYVHFLCARFPPVCAISRLFQ